MPWATWYESTTGIGFGGHSNVFASRFDNTGDANQGKWLFGGQGRGDGGGSVSVPSLNIHTNQDAENPSVAGGSTVDPTKPGPWVTWQETTTAPVSGQDEIFVERPIGPGSANCDGVTPAGVADGTGHVPAVGGFCWQETGIGRVGPGHLDASLNVDPTRDGIEPAIAFTGANFDVPWVVWYETGDSAVSGLHGNEMVFAAKAVSVGSGAFQWVAVGHSKQGTLDRTGANHAGRCGVSATSEAQCSLNADPTKDAEDPRVAAGTMDPAGAAVPWVVWSEDVSGVQRIFVSRLVGTGAGARFAIVNGGAPISSGDGDATRPDITFSGNTPYVTWRQTVGGVDKGFFGHFQNASNPTFNLDGSNVPLTPSGQADVREPISSGCTANPFNPNALSCQGGSPGTPFILHTSGTDPRRLLAATYGVDNPTTGGASSITSSSAVVSGTIRLRGARVNTQFQYGQTTSYGSATGPVITPSTESLTSVSSQITGLAPGTTYHYRMVAVSDFGTFVGGDRTFTTAS